MVKVSFNSALAQKDAKKDVETLIPEDEKVSRRKMEEAKRLNQQRRNKNTFVLVVLV